MRDSITTAAVRVLVSRGLNNWSVEEVAKKAGCAKGLVNYHHQSKEQLLRRAAETLRDARWSQRTEALSKNDPGALDSLWAALLEEVRVGRFAAWLSLLASPSLRDAAGGSHHSPAFVRALARALGLDDALETRSKTIEAGLDGLQLLLLQGVPAPEVEEAYHRFLLVALDM